jgi:hypothetical protein
MQRFLTKGIDWLDLRKKGRKVNAFAALRQLVVSASMAFGCIGYS